VFAPLVGLQIPGGCDDCNAYQTVEKVDVMWLIRVHHDRTCPWYAARRGGAA
jgi:hypothetical protein